MEGQEKPKRNHWTQAKVDIVTKQIKSEVNQKYWIKI